MVGVFNAVHKLLACVRAYAVEIILLDASIAQLAFASTRASLPTATDAPAFISHADDAGVALAAAGAEESAAAPPPLGLSARGRGRVVSR